MKKILLIAGTRPNFIKLAPLYHRLKEEPTLFKPFICHTGQHFDHNMSDIFWQNLELPPADFKLEVKGNGVADTIGKTIVAVAEIFVQQQFDLVIVFGDVNATAAGAIAAAQAQIPVMHVEAGLRSFDRTMPEEINRVITDHVSDWLMVSEPSGLYNLNKEGFDKNTYFHVGNIMIESLLNTKEKWRHAVLPLEIEHFMNEKPVIATFHRPENVDAKINLERIVEILQTLSADHYIIFPVHPRTLGKLKEFKFDQLLQQNQKIVLTGPLGYFEFLKLISNATMVITDSGGIQEETSFLNIPCVTFRKNTERPVTIELGTNIMMNILDDDFYQKIQTHQLDIRNKHFTAIPFWDASVSRRIVDHIKTIM